MAIVNRNEDVYKPLLGSVCFYCGEPVHPPAVMWAGYDQELLLHPPCMLELFLRLSRDVWEIETRTGEYVARTDLFQARVRLVAAEMREPGEVRP